MVLLRLLTTETRRTRSFTENYNFLGELRSPLQAVRGALSFH